MSVPNFGDNYRGGYSSSGSNFGLSSDELRIASSTFANYIGGTVLLVFLIFFVYLIITAMTFVLMGYARFLRLRPPKSGFYNPPPMLTRVPMGHKLNGTYSTLPRSEVGSQKRALSTAMSQNTMSSQKSVTATTTIL